MFVSSRDAARQKRMVLSLPAETNVLPSGENASELMPPLCPLKLATCCFNYKFHKLIAPSEYAVASILPSGKNAMAVASPLCALNVTIDIGMGAHICNPPSANAAANSDPS